MSIITLFSFVFFSANTIVASADSNKISSFDESPITDDLYDIDIDKYVQSDIGKIQIVRFYEYCYTDNHLLKDSYGLYLYIYNPQEKQLLKTSENRNYVNIATQYDSLGNPITYSKVEITYLDGYKNNRLMKFKITDSRNFFNNAKSYASKHDGVRRYDLVGITLLFLGDENNIGKDYKVSKTYYWTGFAKGCSMGQTESTLACQTEGLSSISLDVHPTYYRPQGNNGKDEFTQDSLHSVYFSVPKSYLEKSELYAVHAEWYNAVLKPMLAYGKANIENLSWIDERLGHYCHDIEIAVFGAPRYYGSQDLFDCDWFFNGDRTPEVWYNDSAVVRWDNEVLCPNMKRLETLYMTFMSESSDIDAADNFIVRSEDIHKKMLESPERFGGDIFLDRYAECIFESINKTKIEKTITRDENFPLENEVLDQNWWEKLWNIKDYTSMPMNDVKGIEEVTQADCTLPDKMFSDEYKVALSDVQEIKDYVNEASLKDERVYLFRYMVSDYRAVEATVCDVEYIDPLIGTGYHNYKPLNTNAYFFQETVNLNFDIIDLTFKDELGVMTVVPVVSDPIDIIHDGTPSLNSKSDKDPWEEFGEMLKIIFAVIGIILLIMVFIMLWPFLKPVFSVIGFILQGILYIITLPFRLIGKLFKDDSDDKNRRNRG